MTGGELQQNIMLRHLENTEFLQRMVLQAFGRRGRVPNSLFAVEHLLGKELLKATLVIGAGFARFVGFWFVSGLCCVLQVLSGTTPWVKKRGL